MSECVVHQIAFEKGGGVAVVEEMARALDAPLYIGYAPDRVVSKIDDDVEVEVLFDDVPERILRQPTLRRLFYVRRTQSLSIIRQYDVIFQSGTLLDWYAPSPEQRLVRYAHSAGFPYVEDGGYRNALYKAIKYPTISYADSYLANSELTKREIDSYLSRDSTVVYPPVETDQFEYAGDDEYFLTITRLTSGKRADDLVKWFNDTDYKLIVAGSGPLEDQLRDIASSNISIKGWVSEEEKRRLLSKCSGFIMNSGKESFGITAVEALASGKPVLTRIGGYTPVTDGKNGIIYSDLSEGIRRFDRTEWNPSRIAADVTEQYGIERFHRQIQKELKSQEKVD